MLKPLLLGFLFFSSLCNAQSNEAEQIANQMETCLIDQFLHCWYPRVIDSEFSGTLNTFTRNWKPVGDQDKYLVPQARHVWSASKAGLLYPDDLRYRNSADAGYVFLRDYMWDSEWGGFYAARDRKGKSETRSPYGDEKRVYGNAFGIYGLVAYYELTHEKAALDLAIETFHWIEKHAYDPQHGGYFEQFERNGNVLLRNNKQSKSWERPVFEYKGMNASIHILEAYTSLYHVWPDSVLKEKLSELLGIIQNTIIHPDGYMYIYMKSDWTPISCRDSTEAVREKYYFLDHISFGHDIEVAYLIIEAAHALGLDADSITFLKARQLVAHSLKGWDEKRGGLFYSGYYYPGQSEITILDRRKDWWVQAEAMNTLLLLSRLYPEETKYWQLFQEQWHYIQTYLIDHKYGGWYGKGLDESPEAVKDLKGHAWKTSYHNGRAMMNCIQMLREEND